SVSGWDIRLLGSAAREVVQRRAVQAHPPVPVVELLVDDREQLDGVVARRVGHAERLGHDDDHEQVVLVLLGAGEGAAVGAAVEVAQPRSHLGQAAAGLTWLHTLRGYASQSCGGWSPVCSTTSAVASSASSLSSSPS